MSNKISEDLVLVLSNLTTSNVESYFEMMDNLPEDDDYILRIGSLAEEKGEVLGLDEVGLKAVVIYHLGLLHGGNNVKT